MTDSVPATGNAIPRAAPQDVGLSPVRLALIGESLAREIASGMMPGVVVGITRRGKLAYLEAFGTCDPAAGSPMRTDAVFSIASMTKPMVSAAIMQLAEEGRLLLGDPVGKFLPELADLRVAKDPHAEKLETVAAVRPPTIQDLLRHTAGFTYASRGTSAVHKATPGDSISAAIKMGRGDFLAALGRAPLLCQPGSMWEYGFSTDVLGHVIEAVTGERLGEVLRRRIWQPLGMAETAFLVPPDKAHRYARAFAVDPLSGGKVPVRDATLPTKWESGGGGAVSTAADYLKFTEMMRQGGTLGGVRILGRKTVELMRSDHLAQGQGDRIAQTMDPACAGYGFGLGFAVRLHDGVAPMPGSAGEFFWSGVYGTYFWIDPREEMTVVLMAATPGMLRLRYRPLIRALVYQALEG